MHHPELLTDYHLYAVLTDPLGPGQAAAAALAGDYPARCAVADYLTELGDQTVTPFEPGKCYLIETVTLYYVGRVTAVAGGFVQMEDASWVHWTGRKSTLCRLKKFKGFGSGETKARTEFVDQVGISLASIVSYLPGDWTLPKESIL